VFARMVCIDLIERLVSVFLIRGGVVVVEGTRARGVLVAMRQVERSTPHSCQGRCRSRVSNGSSEC
jgi:hypothetical protein